MPPASEGFARRMIPIRMRMPVAKLLRLVWRYLPTGRHLGGQKAEQPIAGTVPTVQFGRRGRQSPPTG